MNRPTLDPPRYHKVFGLLCQRIAQGTYPVGSQMGTEDELASEFGVSRATVRQAVGELVNRGMVARRQGRGTFVTAVPASGHSRVVGSLDDLVRETSYEIKSATLSHGSRLPDDVAILLECSEPIGTILERIRTIGDEVFVFTRQFFSGPIGQLLTSREVDRYGVLTALHRQGVYVGGCHQVVRAELADVEVAERLGIEMASSVLFAERVNHDEAGAPIELVRAWYRGDLYEYQSSFRLTVKDGRAVREPI